MFKIAFLILSLLISGCASPVPTFYYTLDTVSPTTEQNSAHSKSKRVVGIGPTTLPSLLNRKAIVTRNTENAIQLATTQQWAEPLIENIPRVIARNLALSQPSHLFHVYPWTAFGNVDHRIVIEILQFDAQLGKSVTFEAIWALKDEQKQQTLQQNRTKLERPLKSENYAEMVNTMNQILGIFSQELSEALCKI